MEFDSEGCRVWKSPVIEVQTAIGRLGLTWLNTTICTFKDSQYDHVAVRVETDEGEELCAIAGHQELINALMSQDYPHDFRPVPEYADVQLLVDREMQKLEVEFGS